MGEWSGYGRCLNCDTTGKHGKCGKCKKLRVQEVAQYCAHGGDCTCERKKEQIDCEIPCRKKNKSTFYPYLDTRKIVSIIPPFRNPFNVKRSMN